MHGEAVVKSNESTKSTLFRSFPLFSIFHSVFTLHVSGYTGQEKKNEAREIISIVQNGSHMQRIQTASKSGTQ